MKYLCILFCALWIFLSNATIFDNLKGKKNPTFDEVAGDICAYIFSIVADGFCWYLAIKLLGL